MGGGSESNTVNEGDYLLKTLENERNVYSTLLEDTSISYQQREILETKYEVIQEALGVAIIAAVIAAVGVLILLIAKVMKSTSSASNTVKTKIKEVNKKLEDKIDDNNKTSKDKQNSDNYLQNMLYIDKYAVSILSSFINGIHNLEIKRASFAAQYWGLYVRCVNKYIGRSNQSANNIKSVKKG